MLEAVQHMAPPVRSVKTANLEALAFKVSPDFRKRFRQRAVAADLKLNELLFAALAAWEMKHAAGVQYLDFTPVMIVALASVVGARYLAIGTGDTELYLFAGMLAAVVISIRVFLFRGAGKAN